MHADTEFMAPICSSEMRPSMPAVGSACSMCSSPPAQNTTICWLFCAHGHHHIGHHHHHGHHHHAHHHCRPPHHWTEHRLTVGLCPWPIRCVGSGKRLAVVRKCNNAAAKVPLPSHRHHFPSQTFCHRHHFPTR